MIRLLFIVLGAMAAAVLLGHFLQQDPGRMVFSYAGTTVQMSFALFVILLLLALALFYAVVQGAITLLRMPAQYRRWSAHRRSRHSEKFLTQGLVAMLEGQWPKAEDSFRRGAAVSRVPMLNYLFAARAAQQQGASSRRDHYLRLAHEYSPEQSCAVGLTRAELLLNQQQTEQAYAALQSLDAESGDRDQVKLLLLQAGSELSEWSQVLDMLAGFRRRKALPESTIRARELDAYAGLLRAAGESGDRPGLDEAWNRIPKKLRNELYLIETYVEQSRQFPDTGHCEQILRQALKVHNDPALVRLYGLVQGADAARQLAFAERMLPGNARDAVLLLTLGRLCIRNSLWGKARSYLDESIAAAPSPDAHQELADLLTREGEYADAARHYRAGLNLATGVASESVQVKLLENYDADGDLVAAAGARKVV